LLDDDDEDLLLAIAKISVKSSDLLKLQGDLRRNGGNETFRDGFPSCFGSSRDARADLGSVFEEN
jgi:hypothetical protein